MKKAAITLLFILLIVAGSASILYRAYAVRKSTPEEKAPIENKLPNVAVEVLRPTSVEDTIVLTGMASPWESVTLSAEISGKLEWQGVDDGEVVEAGQELIRIDTTSAQARLDQALAKFELTKQEYTRVAKLQEGGISSPREYDQATTNREAAEASVRLAEIELGKSVITAQIEGVLDQVFNEEGEFVSVGKPLLRIVQVDKIKVLLGMPERDVIYCRIGQPVQLEFDAYPGKLVQGTVHRIATTAELSTRTFRVEIAVNNQDGGLKPGMNARARFVRTSYPEAITVPLFAVMNRGDEQFVFVENEDQAELREIQTGFLHGGRVVVTAGLAPGERVVVTGQRDIRDGQAVRIGEVIN
jgi:membrane fusion protein, multidrug efflux system